MSFESTIICLLYYNKRLKIPKGITRSRKFNDRQYNGTQKKKKKNDNDSLNTTQYNLLYYSGFNIYGCNYSNTTFAFSFS